MIIFREEEPGNFDLHVDGRIVEYDVEPDEFRSVLRRRRIDPAKDGPVYTEDTTGYRQRLTR